MPIFCWNYGSNKGKYWINELLLLYFHRIIDSDYGTYYSYLNMWHKRSIFIICSHRIGSCPFQSTTDSIHRVFMQCSIGEMSGSPLFSWWRSIPRNNVINNQTTDVRGTCFIMISFIYFTNNYYKYLYAGLVRNHVL